MGSSPTNKHKHFWRGRLYITPSPAEKSQTKAVVAVCSAARKTASRQRLRNQSSLEGGVTARKR